jgi:hypothetical protein
MNLNMEIQQEVTERTESIPLLILILCFLRLLL